MTGLSTTFSPGQGHRDGFPELRLYPHMTVFDNMAFGLKLRKVPKDEIKKRVHEAAKILEIEHLLDRKRRLSPVVRGRGSRSAVP